MIDHHIINPGQDIVDDVSARGVGDGDIKYRVAVGADGTDLRARYREAAVHIDHMPAQRLRQRLPGQQQQCQQQQRNLSENFHGTSEG